MGLWVVRLALKCCWADRRAGDGCGVAEEGQVGGCGGLGMHMAEFVWIGRIRGGGLSK